MLEERLFENITKSVFEAAKQGSLDANSPENHRGYECSHDGCDRVAYASGYCNGHYIRKRNGTDMNRPFRRFTGSSKISNCKVCGDKVGKSGGWGYCQKHYRKARYTSIKKAAIKALGDCCYKCKQNYPLCVYDFHHIGVKEYDPSHLIINSSVDKIAKELSKCVLLCANCHRMEHHEREL